MPGPLMENCTGAPTAIPLAALSCTTRGAPKAVLTMAVWLLPDTIERPVTVMLGMAVALKVTLRPLLVAVTVTAPFAFVENVSEFEVCPEASVVVVVLPRIAAPAGLTDQFTVWPARPAPAAESTSTTRFAASRAPACADWELPEMSRRAAGTPGVTRTLNAAGGCGKNQKPCGCTVGSLEMMPPTTTLNCPVGPGRPPNTGLHTAMPLASVTTVPSPAPAPEAHCTVGPVEGVCRLKMLTAIFGMPKPASVTTRITIGIDAVEPTWPVNVVPGSRDCVGVRYGGRGSTLARNGG